MFKVEFSIVHQGCFVNELSREFPEIRIICPGGFAEETEVEELIILDNPTDDELQAVMDFVEASPKTRTAKLLERTADKAFILFDCPVLPETFCSKVVEKNHAFKIGMETQRQGLESWRVACAERSQAEQLLKDLEPLGEVKHKSISETSWQELLDAATT